MLRRGESGNEANAYLYMAEFMANKAVVFQIMLVCAIQKDMVWLMRLLDLCIDVTLSAPVSNPTVCVCVCVCVCVHVCACVCVCVCVCM